MPGTVPLLILTVLCLCVALADGLARLPLGRIFGAPALSLLLAMIAANTGLLPGGSQLPPLYASIFVVVAPMAIFYLLLDAHPRQLLLGAPMLLLAFFVGALGTVLGGAVALALTHLDAHFGEAALKIAATFVAGFVGSGAEFEAMAERLQIAPAIRTDTRALFALVAALWVLLSCLLPALLMRLPRFRHGSWIAGHTAARHAQQHAQRAHEQLASLGAFALLLTLGLLAYGVSEAGAAWLARQGLALPSILLIGLLALLLAPTALPSALPGSRALGRFGVCLFLAVLGAHAELSLLPQGAAGVALTGFVVVMLAVHLALVMLAGAWLRVDPDLLAIASQAGIGGASTAMAVAESRQRHDLAMPAILAGSLGNLFGVGAGLALLWLLG